MLSRNEIHDDPAQPDITAKPYFKLLGILSNHAEDN